MKKAYWFLLPLLALASCQGLLGSSSSEETASSSDASSSSSSATASSSEEEAASSSAEEESISSSSSSEETSQKALQIADIKNILVYYGLLDGSAPFEPVAPEVKDQDGNIVPLEDVTFSFEGDDIRYENGGFIGLRGGTSTTVTATSKDGATGAFTVSVYNREYREKHEAAATSEGWYGDIEIDPIASLEEGFASGIDISSSLSIYESCGRYYGAFYNENGEEQSLYQILADNGVNWIRLRLWVDPYNHNLLDEDGNPTPYGGGICDYEHVEWMAHEAKMAGLSVLLDFHYSDTWADPDKQYKPSAWEGLTGKALEDKLYEYTRDVLSQMKDAGVPPAVVQVGNEINHGLVWPEGRLDDNSTEENWAAAMGLYKAGARAVREVLPDAKLQVHLALGGENTLCRQYLDYMDKYGAEYDIIGLSYYERWHETYDDLKANVYDLAERYGKPICVCEYGAGVENVRIINDIVRSIPGGLGYGTMAWAPSRTLFNGPLPENMQPAAAEGTARRPVTGGMNRELFAIYEQIDRDYAAGKQPDVPAPFVRTVDLDDKIIGADISWVPQEEARGKKYSDKGEEKDILEIMSDYGFNWIRLRLFVDPTAENGYSKDGCHPTAEGYAVMEEIIMQHISTII